jgi:shikimate dehydrogenase
MRTYGLIGYPLGHSFSRRFFTEKFALENKHEQYLNFEISPIDGVLDIILDNPELVGLNVTIPYKTLIIPFMEVLDETAMTIGAVNTIRIERHEHGRLFLKGFNTDVYGFEVSLRPMLKPHHRKALVLGTGGASRAILFVLEKLGIETLTVSRRMIPGAVTYKELTPEIMNDHTVIINTTPLGTAPDTGTYPDIPYEYASDRHLFYDLVYNPAMTLFMEKGLQTGAAVKNGYEMLEMQALKSYEIWNSPFEG